MCFLRALGVVMFLMVSSFRLDKDVYMRGMEGWDIGKWRGGGVWDVLFSLYSMIQQRFPKWGGGDLC